MHFTSLTERLLGVGLVLACALDLAAPRTAIALESRAAELDPIVVPPWGRPGWVRGAHLQPDFLPTASVTATTASTSAIRPLPYPFAHVISVTADADMSSLHSVDLFEHQLCEKYGLNVAQSFFFHGFCEGIDGNTGARLFNDESPTIVHAPSQGQDGTRRSDSHFAQMMFRGAFDFMHSYSDDSAIPVPLVTTMVAVCGADRSAVAEQRVKITRQLGLKPSIGLHGEIQCDPGVRRVDIDLVDQAGNLYRIDPFAGAKAASKAHFVQRWSELRQTTAPGSTAPGRFIVPAVDGCKAVRLTVEGTPGAKATLESLRFVTLDRPMVARQIRVARQMGVTQSVAIRHGGFTGQGGHTGLGRTGLREPRWFFDYQESADERVKCEQNWSADVPGSPFYHFDLLRKTIGLEIIDDFLRKVQNACSLDYVLHTVVASDGVPYYSIFRLVPQPESLVGLKLEVPRVTSDNVQTMGSLIELVLRKMSQVPNQVGLLYTHYSSSLSPKWKAISTADSPFHPNTVKGFEILHLRHYDPFGDVAPGDRVWVTRIPTLVRFVMVSRAIEKHAQIDFAASRVALSSWREPVLGRDLPAPSVGCGELHGQTFYVQSSATAEVTLDGKPLTSFKRNPPDASKRASITLVDDSSPVPLWGGFDPRRQGNLSTTGCTLTTAPQGLLRGRSHLVLKVDAAAAEALWQPRFVETGRTGWVRCVYRKSNPDCRVSVTLKHPRGVRTTLRESGATADGAQGWAVPAAGAGLTDVVVDLVDMALPANGCKLLPHGPLQELSVRVEGAKPGDTVEIDRIEMLRENPRPLHLMGASVVIAGRLKDSRPDVVVHLLADGREHLTVSDGDGYYMFSEVPRGAVAELWVTRAGQRVEPADGSAFLALNDRADLDL